MALPAAALSASRFTIVRDALFIVSTTSSRSLLPPNAVVEPDAVIAGETPRAR